MRLYDIIEKKRDGFELSDEEIQFVISGYVAGEIPDYQISALLMAIYFRGMNDRETLTLTKAMMYSGDTIDLYEFGNLTVDKHSTGGVGDKTSLVVAPLMASLGCKMAKMSGRGLGHTGGTVDKLESIPGYNTAVKPEAFFEQVRRVGVAVIGSTANLAPADKKLYALRDVTATVNCTPLIASSIMSKKLAAGAHNIVLDVKVLAEKMVSIGKGFGRNIAAVLTNMGDPLGFAVGNSVEVIEAVSVLKGGYVKGLSEVCTELAVNLLMMSRNIGKGEALSLVEGNLKNGAALDKFKEWISAQGGDDSFTEDYSLLGKAKYSFEYKAQESGYISSIDAEKVGKAASLLGAGRARAGDEIDFNAGIIFAKKTGDRVEKGETAAILYYDRDGVIEDAEEMFGSAIAFGSEKPKEKPFIYETVK